MPEDTPSEFPPTAHVKRILLVLSVGLLLFIVGRRLLVPDDHTGLGGYRRGALFEIMEKEPVHQGKDACGRCHQNVYGVHQKDIHFDVQCEDCHGPGRDHTRYHMEDEPPELADAEMLPKEYTLEGCLYCHREIKARPRTFPQVDPESHYAFLHVTDPETRCNQCHDPHEPIFLLTRVADARIHPVIYECSDCHDEDPAGDHGEVVDHPVIFTCRDCHPEVVADFRKRKHSFMRCTACHLFHRENETAGRIFMNGNRRFCQLCHEKKPFKDAGAQPQVDSVEHLKQVAEMTDQDPEKLLADPRACLPCHFGRIHGKKVVKLGGRDD